MEAGPDFFREVFSHLIGMHKIIVDFWRDTGIPVYKSSLKFYFQNFCTLIISYRVQNNRFYRLPFHFISPLSYKCAQWIIVFIKVLTLGNAPQSVYSRGDEAVDRIRRLYLHPAELKKSVIIKKSGFIPEHAVCLAFPLAIVKEIIPA